MSESDDTDILLLIPPDFFAVHHSDSEDSCYDSRFVDGVVVNDLITQVCDLENRLTVIESKENLSPACAPVRSPRKDGGHSKEDMSQQTWHNLNASTPRSRLSRATSLPPTPTGSGVSGGPLFLRTNSYPSPSKSSAISPERSSPFSRNVFNRSGHQNGLTAHPPNGEAPTRSSPNFRNYVPSRRDPKQLTKARSSETFKEIDNIFHTIRGRYGVGARDIEGNASSLATTSPQVNHLGMKEVDRLLEKMESEQQEVEAKLTARERQFGLPVGEEMAKATRIKSFPGDSITSVPDLNLGVRKLWDDGMTTQPPKGPSATNGFQSDKPNDDAAVEEPCVQKKYGLLTKDGSDRTDAYSSNGMGQGYVKYVDENEGKQVPKVFASRRRLDLGNISSEFARLPEEGAKASFDVSSIDLESTSTQRGRSSLTRAENSSVPSDTLSAKSIESAAFQSVRGDRPTKGINKGTLDDLAIPSSLTAGPPQIPQLMSLANLWGEKNMTAHTLEQRLEEEKCRREHCENWVQTLQARLLEAQQRLAVAQRVDAEKDAAIQHLHSTWTKISDAWNGLEGERDSLAHQLQSAREAFDAEKEQLTQKLAKCQSELSKALDLAHGYKEQSVLAERTRAEQLQLLGDKVQEVERRLAAAKQAQQDAEVREQELRDSLTKETGKNAELQKTLNSVKKTLSQREADVSVLNEEKGSLQTKLKEERSRGDTLQQSRDSVRREAEDAGKRERTLQAEVRQLTQQLSSIRSELRDFYQEQLERAVRDKLTEFQSQLDAAEAALQREAENREFAMAELAARQLKQITNKHKQEVALLEQRHAEQLHLVQLQKTQAEQNHLELQKRLEEHEANASNLAQRLHGIMQNQWREALSVVSVPKSGRSEPKAATGKMSTGSADGVDFGNGQSWLLVKQQEQESRRRHRAQKEHQAAQEDYVNSQPQRRQWSGLPSNDEIPFEQEGQLTQRSSSTTKLNPQASNSSGDSSEELKKYISMLLDRAPGRPLFETTPSTGLVENDGGKAGKINEKAQSSGGRDSRNSFGKPPWK